MIFKSITTGNEYTLEDLEALCDIGILPSSLGVFGKCDEVSDDHIDAVLLSKGLDALNKN